MSLLIKRLIICILFALVFMPTNSFIAADPIILGEARKGRYVFRKCVACHKNNNTPVICPEERTQQQWDDYFNMNFDKCRASRTEKNFLKYQFTKVQLVHLQAFLRKYAKDSEERFTMCE